MSEDSSVMLGAMMTSSPLPDSSSKGLKCRAISRCTHSSVFFHLLTAIVVVSFFVMISWAEASSKSNSESDVFRPRLVRLRAKKTAAGAQKTAHQTSLSPGSSKTGSTRAKRTITNYEAVEFHQHSSALLSNFTSPLSYPRVTMNLTLEGPTIESTFTDTPGGNDEEIVEMSFFALGKKFNFTLVRDDRLVSPQFAIIKRVGNFSEILSNPFDEAAKGANGCLFTGTKFDSESGEKVASVAVSLCHGILGVIQDESGDFVVRPLAASQQKNFPSEETSRDQTSQEDTSLEDHVIYRANNLFSDYYSSAKMKYDPEQTYFDESYESAEPKLFSKRKTRRKRRVRSAPPLGTRLYMELAVFVDRFLLEHMKKNFPDDTDDQTITIVMAMMNAVHLLYNDESLGYPIDVVLKRLELLESDPLGLMWPFDIDRLLTEFCEWQEKENPEDDSNPLHWDHALLLTGLDLFTVEKDRGKINSEVVGLAPVGGMCTKTSSCTVNEGRHFETVYVVAHEIGHSLGMRHDGAPGGNNCDPGTFIMSPTLGSGKITWSPCSRRYLIDFLESSESDCLKDPSSPAPGLDHAKGDVLPGEKFNPDQQCVLKYGRDFVHSSEQDLRDICRDLHCQIGRVKYTSHPALEGSNCGVNKWCRRGRCDSKTLVRQARDGAWGTWSAYSPCKSECLYGVDGDLESGSVGIRISTRHCNNPYPEFGGKECHGMNKKYMVCDHHVECSSTGRRRTIEDYANRLCAEEARFDDELTGQGLQREGLDDADRACAIWCRTKAGGFTNRGWSFPDGTKCSINGVEDGRSFCLGGRCQAFQCTINSMFLLSEDTCRTDFVKERNDAGWGAWEADEGCSQSACIRGAAALQPISRECRADDWNGCKGSSKTHRICQARDTCRTWANPHEYSTNFCTRHRPTMSMLSGVGMQLPATADDPDRPCRIACQDKDVEYRFYRANGDEGFFPAGTSCGDGPVGSKKHYCVKGKCLHFGSDGLPENVDTLSTQDDQPSQAAVTFTTTEKPIQAETPADRHFESTKLDRDADRYRYEWNSSRTERDSDRQRFRWRDFGNRRNQLDYPRQDRVWLNRPTANDYYRMDITYRIPLRPRTRNDATARYRTRFDDNKTNRRSSSASGTTTVGDSRQDPDRDYYSVTSRWSTSSVNRKGATSSTNRRSYGQSAAEAEGSNRRTSPARVTTSWEDSDVAVDDQAAYQRRGGLRDNHDSRNSQSSKYYSSARNKYTDPDVERHSVKNGGVREDGVVAGYSGESSANVEADPAAENYRRPEQLETHRWKPKYRSDSSWPPVTSQGADGVIRGRYKFSDAKDAPSFRRRYSKFDEADTSDTEENFDTFPASYRPFSRASSTKSTRRRAKRSSGFDKDASKRRTRRSSMKNDAQRQAQQVDAHTAIHVDVDVLDVEESSVKSNANEISPVFQRHRRRSAPTFSGRIPVVDLTNPMYIQPSEVDVYFRRPSARNHGRASSRADEVSSAALTMASPYYRLHPDAIEGSFLEWQVIFSPCSPVCGKNGSTRKVEVRCLAGGVPVHDSLCDDWRRPWYPSTLPCPSTVNAPCHSSVLAALQQGPRTNVTIANSGSGESRRRRHWDMQELANARKSTDEVVGSSGRVLGIIDAFRGGDDDLDGLTFVDSRDRALSSYNFSLGDLLQRKFSNPPSG